MDGVSTFRLDLSRAACLLIAGLGFQTLATQSATGQVAPVADHHQHLFSPAVALVLHGPQTIAARDVIALRDSAGIRRAYLRFDSRR